MDFLKCMWVGFVFLFSALGVAAPPEDLIQNPQVDQRLKRPLNENDLVFVEADTRGTQGLETSLVTHNVIGRSLPDRSADALFKMKKGEYVQVTKSSKDGRWLAIYSLKARRRAWVPRGAISYKVDEKPAQKAPQATPKK